MGDLRGTGRTTRMLLKAMLSFLEGNNILITAYSLRYAKSFSYKIMDMMYAAGITKDILRSDQKISFNGKQMFFDVHNFDKRNYSFVRGDLHVISDHHWIEENYKRK